LPIWVRAGSSKSTPYLAVDLRYTFQLGRLRISRGLRDRTFFDYKPKVLTPALLGRADLILVMAERLRDAGFLVMTSLDVMPDKWGKLMSNVNNAVDAITNVGKAEDADVDAIRRAAKSEMRELLKAADISWVSAAELGREWPETAVAPRGRVKGRNGIQRGRVWHARLGQSRPNSLTVRSSGWPGNWVVEPLLAKDSWRSAL
jgi:hypothetical protein